MSTLDFILIFLLALAALSGLRKGLIRSLGRIVGLVIGAIIASNFYFNFFELISNYVQANEAVLKIASFIILFIVATKLTHALFYLIEKLFNLIAFIPGSKYINNILGAVLGLLEASLFLGLIFNVISRYASFSESFATSISSSVVIPWLNFIVKIILPMLPQAFEAITKAI